MGTPFFDHIPACGWITLSWWPDTNVNGRPAIRGVDETVIWLSFGRAPQPQWHVP